MKRRKDIGGDKEIGEEVMDVIERDEKKERRWRQMKRLERR